MGGRRSPRQGGFTLVELLLGIVLMGIFGLALVAFYSTAASQATTHQNQAATQAEVRAALGTMTSQLRQAISADVDLAPPIESLTPTSIVFYYDGRRDPSDLTVKPQRVRYSVVSGQLVREVAEPSGAAPPYTYGAYGSPVTLVSRIDNGATPVFSGFTSSGAAMASSLDVTATRDLAQITIRIIAGYRTGNADSTLDVSTDVVPRNPRKGT